MNKSTVARRYATALFNLLDPPSIEASRNNLLGFSDLLNQSSDFKHVLASPVFTLEEKKTVLNDLSDRMGSPAVMRDFLGQLLKKNRVGLLPEIAEAFNDLADQHKGVHHVWVSSAKDMSPSEQQQLQAQLGNRLHRDVKMTFQTDPSLVAGLKIRIGSRVYDNTVRGKLAGMRALLAKG